MKLKGIGLSILLVSVLSACGDGSGDSSSQIVDTQETTGGTTDTADTTTTGGTTGDTTTTGGTTVVDITTTGGNTEVVDTSTTGGVTDTGGTADTGDTTTTTGGTTDDGDSTTTGGDTTGDTDAGPAIYQTPIDVAQCSVDDIKGRVDFDMRDYYIYYDQVPQLNLADYDSGNALIRDLRVRPDIYSSVRDAATQSSLFEEGRTKGYGFVFQPSTDGVVRFRLVDIGSPGYDAGVRCWVQIVLSQWQ